MTMKINIFHVLGPTVVDFMTHDERRIIDQLSARLSNSPEFEERLRADFTQEHLDRIEAAERDALEYATSVRNSFAK